MNIDIEKRKLYLSEKIRILIKNSESKTLQNFADQFGCDVRTVSNWVNKGINSISTIYELCMFFKIDFDEFIRFNKEDKI